MFFCNSRESNVGWLTEMPGKIMLFLTFMLASALMAADVADAATI